MMPFTEDIASFYGTIYGGIMIGLLFDINKVVKMSFKVLQKLALIFDSIFWILSTTIIFITVNAIESFDLRYYHFIALFVGFILYYKTLSKFVIKILSVIIITLKMIIITIFRYIKAILEGLYYIAIYFTHLIYDFIFFIPNIFLEIKKGLGKKYRSKLKIKKKV